MPGSTGRTHDAEGTRAPVSTTPSRQTPTGVSFCKWQRVGIGIPFSRAASNTLVPAGTCTVRPSMVISTVVDVFVVLTIPVSLVSAHYSRDRCQFPTLTGESPPDSPHRHAQRGKNRSHWDIFP